ncbi:MAG TPA: MFS transporter [Acidimicrobiales bacterium]|nr:MFS transporter [Acidimicrobiales bacterium]
MTSARVPAMADGRAGGSADAPTRWSLGRFLFFHEIDEYPDRARRTGYLAVAVLATIVLYYAYYTQFGVTPNILRSYHMSFSFFVWVVIVTNLLGAFASLPASKTDVLGRSNVIIYGLLAIGLLVTFGVPNAGSEWSFAVIMSAIGLVEGAILVATPAMVRDYSPQIGRASAMGFWTVGPVAGSLITSIVANRTLSHFVDWQSQFIISGITALVVFVISLFFMRDLSRRLREQLMVSARDQTLVEARARGLSEEQVDSAVAHPWRQIAKWDLVGSSFGIAVFLLVYYAAAGFFTIYFTVNFVNANGTPLTTSQVNGINTWFWATDIVALIVAGLLSDWVLVRKPFMLVGAFGSIATLIAFLSLATHPHTSTGTLSLVASILAVFLSLAYAPWMASYTETVEAKNPALVATGLALWGWILRLVVGISFIFLPVVITSVNPVADNEPLATTVCYPQPQATRCVSATKAATLHVHGQSMEDFLAEHTASVDFAKSHAALLDKIAPYSTTLAKAGNGTAAAIARVSKALGPVTTAQVLKVQDTLKTLVEPYSAQLNFLRANEAQFLALTKGIHESPNQWQHWFWIDLAGMVVFIPTIWLTRGRWSPRRARRDEEEHREAVAGELKQLEAAGTATAA